MRDLNKIEDKAWDLAEASAGADEFFKAVQAVQTIKEIRDSRKPPAWPLMATPISALMAVFLTAMTFIYQAKQAKATVIEERNAREDQRWTEIMGKISLQDPASMQVSAFGLQSFFDSEKYGAQARDMASAILPFTDNNTGFEAVWKSLARHTKDASQQNELIAVASRVSTNLRDLFHGLKGRDLPAECPKTEIAEFSNHVDDCYPSLEGAEGPEAKRGWLYSWEVDSMTETFAKIWQDKDKNIHPAALRLSGIIFVNANKEKANFRQLDFTNTFFDGAVIHLCDISHASFKDAKLKGAELHDVYDFDGSTWDGADWWNAEAISPCKLVQYLNTKYPPTIETDRVLARRLSEGCNSQGAQRP